MKDIKELYYILGRLKCLSVQTNVQIDDLAFLRNIIAKSDFSKFKFQAVIPKQKNFTTNNHSENYFHNSSYNEYNGYNGYSDEIINGVFDGDPSLTWNID